MVDFIASSDIVIKLMTWATQCLIQGMRQTRKEGPKIDEIAEYNR